MTVREMKLAVRLENFCDLKKMASRMRSTAAPSVNQGSDGVVNIPSQTYP